MKKLLLSAAMVLAMVASATAGTINLQLQQDANAPVVFLGGGASSFSATNQVFGDFLISNITGSTQPSLFSPEFLSTNSLAVQNGDNDPHTLQLWITGNDLGNVGLNAITSRFSNVTLTPGWSVTLETLYSATNQMFAGTLLNTATFNTAPNSTSGNSVANFDGNFSLTAHYTITTTGLGQANSGIDISAVPGPVVGAGLPGLIMACGGLLALARRRRQQVAA